MRLEGQMKMGFYPCPAEAIRWICGYLRTPADGRPFAIIDPCAGEGEAIRDIAAHLGVDAKMVYAIELDKGRAEKCRVNLPGANVLGPASAFGVAVNQETFGFAWVNPPFDNELGGGRVEADFIKTVSTWLVPGGVMCLVCPKSVVGRWDISQILRERFRGVVTLDPPEGVCKYGEVMTLAVRRTSFGFWYGAGDRLDVYDIQHSDPPETFAKSEPTEQELAELLERSPLRSILKAKPEFKLPSPPMALGHGHVAMLLASGHLDGVVAPDFGPAHVIRGTARKHTYVQSVAENEEGDTKTVMSERFELVVRAVGNDGVIKTYAGKDGTDE